MANDTLTITDNRTGQTYTLPISGNAITATDLCRIKGPDGAELIGSGTHVRAVVDLARFERRMEGKRAGKAP